MSASRPPDGVTGAGVAIIGMACIFPGAPDLETYRRNLEAGVDAIREVPPTRWEPVFYDPDATAVDRFYCRRGGFVDEAANFDALAWGIMPVAAQGAEPDQLITLEVAARALRDAGYDPLADTGRALPRERTAVLLGRGNYLGAGMTRLAQHVRTAEQLVVLLRDLVPGVPDEQLARIKRDFQKKHGAYGPDTAIGLVPNLTASRIANRLDLRGPAFTIDAACASTLIAVDHAVHDLVTGRTDLALAGGVHLTHDVAFWSVFTQLGALSRRQEIRPFDRDADGILPGEGIGIVVLKRLGDARRDDDRIYAVIQGSGTASDGRAASLMVPAPAGQRLALERAWRMAGETAGLTPDAIGLVEAHGTGTPVGDAAELETLGAFFGPAPADGRPRAGLGTVKSMIGHAMPAAGAAGLIKAALAVHHGLLLPTLHCENPRDELARTRFRVLQAAEPWETEGRPRVAGVNAFGFGGINAHVVLAGDAPPRRSPRAAALGARAGAGTDEEILLLAAETPAVLAAALDGAAPPGLGSGPVRLALVDPTPERRAKARDVVLAKKPRAGRDGLWFSPRGMLAQGGRLAFLFPGVEAAFEARVADVARHFGRPMPDLDAVDLERQGAGVVVVGKLLHDVLVEVGVRPDALAGHSVGEWAAMIAAEVVAPESLEAFLGEVHPGDLVVPDVAYAAIGAAAATVAPHLAGAPDTAISHDNCPHQSILCGPEAQVDDVLARLRDARVLGQKLPFRSGFHSRAFAPFLAPHRANLKRLGLRAGRVPLWSATTCAPYPADGDAIADLAIEHLVRPVRFRELVEALYADGVRAFVQLGSGSLVGFVSDTLRGRPHLALSATAPQRSGLAQLRRVVAALFVEGLDPAWERLAPPGAAGAAAAPKRRGKPIPLPLGVPLVRLDERLTIAGGARTAGPASDLGVRALSDLASDLLSGNASDHLHDASSEHPVVVGFRELLRDVGAAGDAILRAWQSQPAAPAAVAPAAAAARPAPVAARPPAAAPAARPAPSGPDLPRERTTTRRLSVGAVPTLVDHSLLPQPEGWPDVSDRLPVVPMTMEIRMIVDAAEAHVPGAVAVVVEGVRAQKWLPVEPPVDVTIRSTLEAREPAGTARVKVVIEGYAEGTVTLAPAYPAAPAPSFAPLTEPGPAPVTAAALYAERWMFHGPAYQSVAALEALGTDGIDGVLRGLPAEGALLDAAGQLFGYWVMATTERDRLAMPIKVGRLTLFGPEPGPDEQVRCAVRVRNVGARLVGCDMELTYAGGPAAGRVWARIEGWEDWRFDTDERLWGVLQHTEHSLFCTITPEGVAIVADAGRSSSSREYLAARYLNAAERATMRDLHERRRVPWLYGRIAAKDAVRAWLRARGGPPRFPVEFAVTNDAEGRPAVRGPFHQDLRISIAHKDALAVAYVSEGRPCGVDVERIEARDEKLRALLTTAEERALCPAGMDADEWTTRCFCAKEAVGKARGTGLQGSPRSFPVTAAAAAGEGRWRLCCAGETVVTERRADAVIGWTPAAP